MGIILTQSKPSRGQVESSGLGGQGGAEEERGPAGEKGHFWRGKGVGGRVKNDE